MKLTWSFTRPATYVLIMAGYNDFLDNKTPSIKRILDLIESCSHTNFIVFSVPGFQSNDYNYKTYSVISKYNSRLRYLIDSYNSKSENVIHFVDYDSTKKTKNIFRKVCNVVLNLIVSNNVFKQKNLKFIRTTLGGSGVGKTIPNIHLSVPRTEVQAVEESIQTDCVLPDPSENQVGINDFL